MAGYRLHVNYSPMSELGLDRATSVNEAADGWLAEDERRLLNEFGSPERRLTWVAGRIATKRLLLETQLVPQCAPSKMTIVSRSDRNTGVAPEVFIENRRMEIALSIAHTHRGVLVSAATGGVCVGVDLVLQGIDGAGFRRLWFAEQEQLLMRRGSLSPAHLWAAKEAVFKLSREFSEFTPGQIVIEQHSSGSLTCSVEGKNRKDECRIECWQVDGQIAALAVRRPGVSPNVLRKGFHSIKHRDSALV